MRGNGKYRILALLIMRKLAQISESDPDRLNNPGKITKTDFMCYVPEKERSYFLGLCGLIDLGLVTTTFTGKHHLVTLELSEAGRVIADSLYQVPALEELLR